MFKSFIKRGLCKLATSLPSGGRCAVLDALIEQEGTLNVFRRHSHSSHICGFVVDGNFGPIQGSSQDDAILPYYARTGVWAENTIRQASEALKEGGTYIDIGANIGMTVAPISDNSRVHIHAFEPEPKNLMHLRANVGWKPNVAIYPIALHDCETTLPFEVVSGNLGDHHILTQRSPSVRTNQDHRVINVPAAPLDSLRIQIEGKLIVKIDTQGSESFVLRGGKETLRFADIVFIEAWPYGLVRSGGDLEELISFIDGFQRSIISCDYRDDPPEYMSIKQLIRRIRMLDPKNCHHELDIALIR